MSKAQRYRKKPVQIEAVQYDGTNESLIINWILDNNATATYWCGEKRCCKGVLGISIRTLEGDMLATPNDYIIKGVQGEFYPCKPDIFEQTYELVESWEPPYDEFADPQR